MKTNSAMLMFLLVIALSASAAPLPTDAAWKRVGARAAAMSGRAFTPVKIKPDADYDYGPNRGLDFQEEQKVTYDGKLFDVDGTWIVPFTRRGTVREPLALFREQKGSFVALEVDASRICFRDPAIRPPLPPPPAHVRYFVEVAGGAKDRDGYGMKWTWRGNGYGRLTAPGLVFGASERGLLESGNLADSADGKDAAFPRLREVWLHRPTLGRVAMDQIYESPEVCFVRRVNIRMTDDETTLEIHGELYPRRGATVDEHLNLGFGFSSMYWHGAREGFRAGNAAHDNDTVEVMMGDRRMTIPVPAPPKNGERPVVKKRRESSDRSIKSWSLMQKDRDPEHFIPNVGYADRASFEIREPVFQLANADGGRRLESELRIIVLDADGEFKDNVVVAQYPLLDRPLKSGERLTISYKMRVGR